MGKKQEEFFQGNSKQEGEKHFFFLEIRCSEGDRRNHAFLNPLLPNAEFMRRSAKIMILKVKSS